MNSQPSKKQFNELLRCQVGLHCPKWDYCLNKKNILCYSMCFFPTSKSHTSIRFKFCVDRWRKCRSETIRNKRSQFVMFLIVFHPVIFWYYWNRWVKNFKKSRLYTFEIYKCYRLFIFYAQSNLHNMQITYFNEKLTFSQNHNFGEKS